MYLQSHNSNQHILSLCYAICVCLLFILFLPQPVKAAGCPPDVRVCLRFFPPGEFFPATVVSCLLSWFPLLIVQSILWCLWVWFSALARKADWLFDVQWIHIIRILTDGIQFRYNEGGLLVAATQDISFVSLCISMYADDLSFFFFSLQKVMSLPARTECWDNTFWNISADKFYASCCKSRRAFMQKNLYIALHHMDKTTVWILTGAINITVCVVIGQSLADYFLSLFPSLFLIHFAHFTLLQFFIHGPSTPE